MSNKQIQVNEKIDRKTLSTHAHILLAQVVEDTEYYERAKKIIAVMQLIKEME